MQEVLVWIISAAGKNRSKGYKDLITTECISNSPNHPVQVFLVDRRSSPCGDPVT